MTTFDLQEVRVLGIQQNRNSQDVYHDSGCGDILIAPGVVAALLAAPSLQRLRGVDQSGYFSVHFPGSEHSRFEHSLGVFELLRRYGASMAECLAGLLHDVSHAVFSHCIDYVSGDTETQKTHAVQDNLFEQYVLRSELPNILASYGYDVNRLLDHTRFPLLERELPELCADRIDYALRAGVAFGEIAPADVEHALHSLMVVDTAWVFRTQEDALWFAKLFKHLNDTYFAGVASAHMFVSVGGALRRALACGYITHHDLYTTDTQVLALLRERSAQDAVLREWWERMNTSHDAEGARSDAREIVWCKSRAVDPLYLGGNQELCRLSEHDADWAEVMGDALAPRQVYVSFLK